MKKNYLILATIFLVTIITSLLLAEIYTTVNNKEILSELTEVEIKRLEEYSIENATFLYVNNVEGYTDFEIELNNYVKENDTLNMLYLNEGINELKMYLSEDFDISEKTFEIIPNIYYLENGKIMDVLYKENKTISLEEVKSFVENKVLHD